MSELLTAVVEEETAVAVVVVVVVATVVIMVRAAVMCGDCAGKDGGSCDNGQGGRHVWRLRWEGWRKWSNWRSGLSIILDPTLHQLINTQSNFNHVFHVTLSNA